MIQLENNCGGQNHRRISYQRLISVVISVLSAVISLWLLNFGEAHAALIQKPATNLGLVGYWSMNEGTGSYAGDSSGNKNTGTLVNGPTWVDGKRGKALNFDGVDDYVDAGSNSITGTSPFTLSAWFNARTHTDYGVAVSIGTENANGQAAYIGWVTTAQIGTNNSLGGGWWGTNYGSGITSSGWHHVVMTFAGGSGGATKIYVDNVEKVSTAFTPNLGTQKIQFGLRTVYEFNGLIDEVRIYNRVLSATEIQALYKSGAATVGKTTKIHKDITLNALTSGSQFNTDPSTTASITPGANRLILAAVATNNSMAAPTLSGNGLTWVQIATTAGSSNRTTLYRAMGAFPSAGAVTIDFVGTPNEVRWSIVEFGNVDTSGTNGSGAIVQAKTGSNAAVSSFTITLNSAPSADSATYGVVNIDTGTAVITPGTGFTEIHDHGSNLQQESEYKITGDQTVDWTSSGTEDWRGVAIEIKKKSVSAAVNTSQNTKLTNGLVGMWSFNGPDLTTTTAYDRSGQGNNGTLTNGPSPAAGKIGQALNFDGVNDYVTASNPTTAVNNWTMAAWINPTQLNVLGFAVQNGPDDGVCVPSTNCAGYGFGIGSGGGLAGSKLQGVASYIAWIDSGYTFSSVNTWYHAIMLRDNGTIKFYVNGVQTSLTSTAVPLAPTTHFRVGSQTGTRFFSGLIDDVRVYNRALTPAEIKRLYNMGR